MFSLLCLADIWQATGIRLGTLVQSVSGIGTGVIIAFVYSWELSLFILGLVPFIAVGGYLEMKVLSGLSGKEALEGAGQVILMLFLFVFCYIVADYLAHSLLYSNLLFFFIFFYTFVPCCSLYFSLIMFADSFWQCSSVYDILAFFDQTLNCVVLGGKWSYCEYSHSGIIDKRVYISHWIQTLNWYST